MIERMSKKATYELILRRVEDYRRASKPTRKGLSGRRPGLFAMPGDPRFF